MRIVACPSEHLTVVPASFRDPAIALADTFVGMNGSPISEPCVYSVVSRTIVTPARLGSPLWVGERSGESGERVPIPCVHQRRSTDSQDQFLVRFACILCTQNTPAVLMEITAAPCDEGISSTGPCRSLVECIVVRRISRDARA